MFNTEVHVMEHELCKSKQPKDIILHSKLSKPLSASLVDNLLKLYLEKCITLHSLAFFQYRATLPKALMYDIKEIFKDKKKTQMDMFNVIEKKLKEVREDKKLSKDDEARLLLEVMKSVKNLRRPKTFAKPKSII